MRGPKKLFKLNNRRAILLGGLMSFIAGYFGAIVDPKIMRPLEPFFLISCGLFLFILFWAAAD